MVIMTNKEQSVKEKILKFLTEKPNSRVKEIASALGKTSGHISVNLVDLKRKKCIFSSGYGKYKVVEQNSPWIKEANERLLKKFDSLDNVDLAVFDTILKLKETYGKEKLLKILKKIIRLME